ncbi:MAG: lectin-like protein [Myxococcota bacterium]
MDAGYGVDAGNPCEIQAGGCFNWTQDANGTCSFTYKCPEGWLCTALNGADVCNQVWYDPGVCGRLIVGARVYLVCNTVGGGWNECRNWCLETLPGFDSATITNAEEHAALGNFLNGDVWVGLTDRNQLLDGTPVSSEGVYVWIDGTPFDYGATLGLTPWCGGEPNNAGGDEDCVEYNGGNNCWNDTECNNSRYCMCSR